MGKLKKVKDLTSEAILTYMIIISQYVSSRYDLHTVPETLRKEAYQKDISDATRDATPATMIVAVVSFEPVPPPGTLSGISTVVRALK